MTIIQNLAVKGFTTKLEGGRLAITPKANLTNSLREFIRANKAKLVSELQAEKQTNLVSSAFVSSYPKETFKNNDELREIKSGKLHEVLNRFIEKGITFDVSTDDFQVIDPANALKTSDRDFLELNSAAILCQLQQSLLVKHLFNHSPEQFEDFAFEIAEREAIMTGDRRESFSIHCEAVKDVSKNWFIRLLADTE